MGPASTISNSVIYCCRFHCMKKYSKLTKRKKDRVLVPSSLFKVTQHSWVDFACVQIAVTQLQYFSCRSAFQLKIGKQEWWPACYFEIQIILKPIVLNKILNSGLHSTAPNNLLKLYSVARHSHSLSFYKIEVWCWLALSSSIRWPGHRSMTSY